MQHVSEVVKILEAAVRHDPRQAISYATLLADKLDKDGEGRQARLLRGVLAKTPAKAVMAEALIGGTTTPRPPMDEDSSQTTVDIKYPDEASNELVLSGHAAEQVDLFVRSVKSRDVLQARGVDIPARLLLHGPPGTGKTSVAHNIAAALGLPLVTARSDTLVSSLLGQTSRNLRAVFDYANRWPCVLFLDEFDALAKDRADAREIGELQRVVIALLQNLDAFDGANVLIAATNHPSLLDIAVWRRFDHTVALLPPTTDERTRIWRDKLESLSPSAELLSELARLSEGLTGAAIQVAALDILRAEVLDDSTTLRATRALRRLARYVWYDTPGAFLSVEEEVRRLRTWSPSVFTIRKLAETFDVSTRQISNFVKESNGGTEPGAPASLRQE
jgi:SpoVK/Ycf46/Vps4 family AAA+-type ATPase